MTSHVLTICLGNHCRSPMAEGLLNDLARRRGLDWQVRSAGITGLVSSRPAANAVAVMREVGVDISGYLGDQLTPAMIDWCDHVLTMEPWHRAEVLDLVPDAGHKIVLLDPDGVPDPMGGDVDMFRRVRDQLARRIEEWAAHS